MNHIFYTAAAASIGILLAALLMVSPLSALILIVSMILWIIFSPTKDRWRPHV